MRILIAAAAILVIGSPAAGGEITADNWTETAGVKPNTEFTIYDDAGYVAKLIIHDVDPLVSGGLVMLVARDRTVEVGDKVTTEVR